MAAALSRSQIERLGRRLVGEGGPADEDLELLHELLLARSEQLDRAEVRVREGLGIVPTSRVKNTETILEKLRRSGGSGLKSIQDLAGMRIVGDVDRRGQDALVEKIVALFGDGDRAPKIVDRRAEPMHGYRAVHVIVFPEDAPIEIQVRTKWQHEWAEFFEKLADLVGRGIRYGEPPARWEVEAGDSDATREALDARHGLIEALMNWALVEGDLIEAVESGEMTDRASPEIEEGRRLVTGDLVQMHDYLRSVAAIEATIRRLRQR